MPIANYVFNETTPTTAATVASSQPVSGGVDNGIPNGVCGLIGDYEALNVIAELIGNTVGTTDVYVQVSTDEGQNWYDIIHFPQLTAGNVAVIYSAPISNTTTTGYPVVVGKNLNPALVYGAPGTGVLGTGVVNGAFTDRLRLVMKTSGVNTSGVPVKVSVVPQRARVRETGE